MKKVFFIHLLPIENYPPVINAMEYLSSDFNIHCASKFSNEYVNYANKRIKLSRSKLYNSNLFLRLLSYVVFYVKTIICLFKFRPECIIYYDSLSSLPAWLYKFFYNDVSIFIHYHEYVTPEEYNTGMLTTKFLHKFLEKRNYKKAKWISQTNNFRKEKFCIDNNLTIDSVKVLPNYPPLSWDKKSEKVFKRSVKIVYVGYSINEKGNYIKELLSWLATQKIKIQLDFYLVNKQISPKEVNSEYGNMEIRVFDAINYNKLPNILKNYNVGLILYKPTSDNYVFNAPNKLFEYLACNLDVWFPSTMIATIPYENSNVYPKVTSLDFNNLNGIDFPNLISREKLIRSKNSYFCEDVYKRLKKAIIESKG